MSYLTGHSNSQKIIDSKSQATKGWINDRVDARKAVMHMLSKKCTYFSQTFPIRFLSFLYWCFFIFLLRMRIKRAATFSIRRWSRVGAWISRSATGTGSTFHMESQFGGLVGIGLMRLPVTNGAEEAGPCNSWSTKLLGMCVNRGGWATVLDPSVKGVPAVVCKGDFVEEIRMP